ncbi:hypothetical protein JOC85_000462 [Bacillus mesophilus]|uniref:Uncharacterized protein n=1 Tax=Bacillus mesophilus TaxID=1808955 RepID=A0A6M0Q2E3_9BACI|nr:hypothetical protein [Bacillus mesophilus]MBM7659695.1 hypothetical protein [Bacillus mesophilus]NEY70561.1 hypothetical protein [Bacillus mesophilus]
MKKHHYKIPISYFSSSEYAVKLSHELDNNAEGLIFDSFIHDLGAELLIDIVYGKANSENNRWYLGGNKDVELYLDSYDEKFYELTINPLSPHGELQIQNLQSVNEALH